MEWKIKLTYFRRSGKYYSDGEYVTQNTDMFAVFEEVRRMYEGGVLPGLVAGHSYFIVYIDANMHPRGYPGLIL